MGNDGLEMLFGVLAAIRGHIPDSGRFEWSGDGSGAGGGSGGLFGSVAVLIAMVACFAAAFAGVALLAIRWLS